MRKLDRKFDGIIFKVKDQSIVPPDQYMVFLAKDDAFPATLRFYREECERQGAGAAQLAAVDQAIEDVEAWRAQNAFVVKTPDVDEGELLT